MAKTILFVFDNDSKNFGEIKLVETRAEAERLALPMPGLSFMFRPAYQESDKA